MGHNYKILYNTPHKTRVENYIDRVIGSDKEILHV